MILVGMLLSTKYISCLEKERYVPCIEDESMLICDPIVDNKYCSRVNHPISMPCTEKHQRIMFMIYF